MRNDAPMERSWNVRVLGSIALAEASGRFCTEGIGLRGERKADGWLLNGVKCFVTDPEAADFFVVAFRSGEGIEDLVLALVDADAAALLGVAQVSDIIAIESADTFKRPIYAGNAIATVQSKDAVKIITVRGTAFAAAAKEGGEAVIEQGQAVDHPGTSEFVRHELSKT